MKAGDKQQRSAAGTAAQGQSLPAVGCLPVRCFRLNKAALLISLLPLAPAAFATDPIHPVSPPKPSAIHAFAPIGQAPAQPARVMPAPQQHSFPPAPGNPHSSVRPGPGLTGPARPYAPTYAPPRTQAPPPGAVHDPSRYNQRPAAPVQPVRSNSYLVPGPSYGTLQAQSNPRQPFSPQNQQPRLNPQPANGATGEHLGSWMKQHQNQSLPEQERSLRQEPGFNRLEPQQQQNLVNHLHQLNQMPPEQRQRTLSRIENMERLTPERRQAVRSSAQQLGALPEDRKRLVKRAFRDLRELPPEQRQSLMNSPQFAGQFSAQERSIMGNLLVVEPYQRSAAAPQQTHNGP